MSDKMYTVEKIEGDLVTLEDRNKKTLFDIEKNILPKNIKEGDILDIINNKYKINKQLTKETKKRIKDKFNISYIILFFNL